MDVLKFIKEMMEYRYADAPCPVYNDYIKSKNKIIYLGLAKLIRDNIEKNMYLKDTNGS